MGSTGYLTLHLVGASLLAVWLYLRLGKRRPTSRRALAVALVSALLDMQAVKLVAGAMSPEAPERTLALLFAVVLPLWTYAFLASLWLLRALTDALPIRYR